MAKKIGFLGLGRMGSLMSMHLAAAGFDVTGYDPVPKALAAAKKNGVRPAKTVAAAVKGADVVCSSLPVPAVVEDVYLGSGGALAAMKRGAVAFELSTSSVALARRIAAEAKKKGITFLDAPVSGSIPHLEKKQVSAMVGGDAKVLKKHRDVLDAFCKSVTHMGASGNGLIMKLVTNHILNIHHTGIAEGLAFGEKAGLKGAKMVKFLQGSAITQLMFYKAPDMAARDYSNVIADVELSIKDLGLSIEEANGLGVPVPLGVAARQQHVSAKGIGLGRADFNAVYESYIHASGRKAKRK